MMLPVGRQEILVGNFKLKDNLGRLNSARGDLTYGYGVGFSARRRGELVVFGHTGSVAGYRAVAFFDPESETGGVALRNVTGGKLDLAELSLRILEDVVAAKAQKTDY